MPNLKLQPEKPMDIGSLHCLMPFQLTKRKDEYNNKVDMLNSWGCFWNIGTKSLVINPRIL